MAHEGIYGKLRILVAFRLLFITVLLAAYFILQLGYGLFPYPVVILLFIIGTYSLNILYLFLIKFRKVNPTLLGYTQLIIDVFSAVLLVFATGGIESWFTIVLLLTVIASSIVLGKRAGFIIATLTGLLYGILIDLQYYKILPIGYSQDLSEKDFLYNIIINFSALYLTAYLIGYLSSGLETARKSLDEKSTNLEELSLFHQDVIENIPSGLFSADLNGNMRLFNKAAEHILGIQRDQALNENIKGLFPFVAFPVKPSRYNGTIELGGRIKHIGMSISIHKNPDNVHVGYIGTFQDLTEIVRLENEIKRREKLSAIGELSASIAHEIRNPLASIKGSIEMMREGRIKDTQQDRLMEIALSEMTRLNNIITDFLTYSNPKPISQKHFDLGEMIVNTLVLLKSSLDTPSTIHFHEDIERPLTVKMDEEKIRQVIWNFLKNAVESIQEEGSISIRTWGEGALVFIEISDTGEGIKKENLDRIFYPFFTTKISGTGLGLAIAYRIIDEHHGSIDVQSQEGVGSRFLMRFPV